MANEVPDDVAPDGWTPDGWGDSSRSTAELILELGSDIEKALELLQNAIDEGEIDGDGNTEVDYEFYARQLLRTIFAYIEGITFSAKITAGWNLLQVGDLSQQERFATLDKWRNILPIQSFPPMCVLCSRSWKECMVLRTTSTCQLIGGHV